MASPKDYTISDKVQKYRIVSIIEEFSDDLMKISGKCIDIGCGPGDITKELLLPILGPNAQIIGTDISQNMIEYANRMYSIKKRLKFEVLDIETKHFFLPKKYISEFNHIFSFHALQWCNDIRKAFKNIYEMLRPNGTILFYMIASHDIFEVLRILARDIRFVQYIPDTMKNISPYQESNNPRKELKELLENIGFKVHHCSLREASYTEKKSENQLLDSIISILTFLEDMPQDLMEEYKNALRSEYIRRKINYKSISNNEEELILDLYKGLVVYGQKIM